MDLRRSSRKRKRQVSDRGAANGVDRDRLSSLPEAIISIILSFLPTKDAVATSALAKSWRRRWREVTSFHVYDGLTFRKRGVSGMLEKMNFMRLIGMAFRNQTADSPNRFCLCYEYPGRVMTYGAYEMRLAVNNLFNSVHLKVLKLAGPILIRLPDSIRLPKLVVLEIDSIRYREKNALAKLISSCPMLHSLTLKRNSKQDSLKVCTIASPTLKHLEISFHSDPAYPSWQHGTGPAYVRACESKRMKLAINAPALEYLNLKDTISDEISISTQSAASVREVDLEISSCDGFEHDMIVDLVEGFDHANFMKLGGNVVEALSIANNCKLSGTFERLTKLVVAYGSYLHWTGLVCLIDRCVKLEVIEIEICSSKKSKARSYYRRNPACVPTCLSSSLRQVTIKGFDDNKGLMAMLKFILDHGQVMETVDLWFDDDEEERYGLLKKILMLSRASSTCKIQVMH